MQPHIQTQHTSYARSSTSPRTLQITHATPLGTSTQNWIISRGAVYRKNCGKFVHRAHTLLIARSPDRDHHVTEGYPLFEFPHSTPSTTREVPRRGTCNEISVPSTNELKRPMKRFAPIMKPPHHGLRFVLTTSVCCGSQLIVSVTAHGFLQPTDRFLSGGNHHGNSKFHSAAHRFLPT